MRIIGGRFRGLGLAAVGKGDAAAHLRPTTDRVRESLFNILGGGRFGDRVEGARVLDLFAGTGALGLEALSRGAEHVTFVENGRVALRLLKSNIEKARAAEMCRVVPSDATRLPLAKDLPTSLVFLDPPYGSELGQRALASAMRSGWLAERALVVWEDASEIDPPQGLSRLDTRKMGQTWLNFFESD